MPNKKNNFVCDIIFLCDVEFIMPNKKNNFMCDIIFLCDVEFIMPTNFNLPQKCPNSIFDTLFFASDYNL